ncbi:acetylglutamate kinase [Candidatus Magnetomonas plexicatena]|uniref:acetylglutamate kinase n=1 Tax=Candidatus Magnetomonas plexicatena TaxID=2552947 RepID=UPI001C76DF8B|nr:acetylglutamate kinase [Nitrospirales bacterium LBB_01]
MPHMTLLKTARILVKKHNFTGQGLREAIPYINAFNGKRFVLKIGGSVLNDLSLIPLLIEDVVFLKKVGISVILVHGGARQLSEAMTARNLPVEVKDGLRVTSAEALELAAEVFMEISQAIKTEIETNGYKGAIFGRDSGLVKSTQIDPAAGLGFVGVPESVDVALLSALAKDVIPIVSAITAGVSARDIGFNVNADDVAGIIASAITAEKLILMTDVDGVLDASGQLLSTLTVSQVEELIAQKVIHGGMIPKVQTCLNTLRGGTQKCHIIKGSARSFMDEILTDRGVGTEFIRDKAP